MDKGKKPVVAQMAPVIQVRGPHSYLNEKRIIFQRF